MKKGYILSFILGIIVMATIGVVADNLLASEINYKNDKSVEEAIDDLYTTQTTTISEFNSQISALTNQNSTLTEQVSSLSNQLANITGVSAFGELTTTDTTTVHTINVGFKPSKVLFVMSTTSTGFYEQWFYDSTLDSTALKGFWGIPQNNSDMTNTGGGTRQLSTFGFTILNTGFTYKAPANNEVGKVYWYAIK